jgi:hypothetical protein
VGIAVVVLAGVGAFLLLSDGDVPLLGKPEPPPLAFEFDDVTVTTTITSGNGDKGDAKARSARAGADIGRVMNSLYTFAYVENDYWGAYDEAWSLFEETAMARAEADVEVLTLGATANDVYEKLTPESSSLAITVLTDLRDRPISAIARVSFVAGAELGDGSATRITSEGAFFLRRGGDGWLIYAYRVDRDEQVVGSASPSAEASP